MKKRVLIACTMQMDIIKSVIRDYQIEIPIVWMDRRLHNEQNKLHRSIQEKIDRNQDVEEILLSYGLCGNAATGLCSANTKLIMPAFDDCICQTLYIEEEGIIRNAGVPEKGCYYLTREWTLDQDAMLPQCKQICQYYGKEDGTQIIREIYAAYHSIVLIENGAYDVEKIHKYAHEAAEYTGMCVRQQKGSRRVMKNLLFGFYDHTIHVFDKGQRIKIKDFM